MIKIENNFDSLDNNYILILTTNREEKESIRSIFDSKTGASVPFQHEGSNLGVVGDRFCLLINGTSGAQEDISIGSICRKVLSNAMLPNPIMVVIVGIAWGNPNCLNINDIIVTSRVCDVSRISIKNSIREIIPFHYISKITNIDVCSKHLPTPLDGQKIHFGEIVSSQTYLADDEERDFILSSVPEALGGDMEAFDVVKDLSVPWFIIKSISDFGGNIVDRQHQNSAANSAAALLRPMLVALDIEEKIPTPKNDSATAMLADAITGDAIHISCPSGNRNVFLRVMNAYVPHIMRRLAYYTSDMDTDGVFAETLAVTIVELAQNAFLHGNATYVQCTFNEISVCVSDNGTQYDPQLLAGERGGAQAWADLRRRYLDTDQIIFSKKRTPTHNNNYKFNIPLFYKEIREAKTNCQIRNSNVVLNCGIYKYIYKESCNTIYFEASDIYTKSLAISSHYDLLEILKEGKNLLISCRSQYQVDYYTHILEGFERPQLKIFISFRI